MQTVENMLHGLQQENKKYAAALQQLYRRIEGLGEQQKALVNKVRFLEMEIQRLEREKENRSCV